jgi:lysophospholipase
MNFRFLGFFILLALFACASPCQAISEKSYANTYKTAVLPFLKSGHQFSFPSADGQYALQGIKLIHPQAKGLIVIINGRAQSILNYSELFYDLYRHGYSVISYDHRGQGLSPHLVPANSQIGHIEHFSDYSADLNAFMEQVVKPLHPSSKGLFLIAHSMGATVATEYLETHTTPPPFEAAVLCAPMYEINTAPYPGWLAHFIVGSLQSVGPGRHYAPGEHDYNPKELFEKNKVTHSLIRWQQMQQIKNDYPRALIAGASTGWVNASLSTTRMIRARESAITVPTLILEAGKDQFVNNQAETRAVQIIPHCQLRSFPTAKHEILMESDPIRTQALREIQRFFKNGSL